MEELPDTLPAFISDPGCFAARFEDPHDRRDRAGRVIVHEVVGTGTEHGIDTFEAFLDRLWPGMDAHFCSVWTAPAAPAALDPVVRAS